MIIDKLKAAAEKATKVWKSGCAGVGHYIVDGEIEESLAACGPEHRESDEDQYKKVIADSKYIAAANPQTILALLKEREVYRKALDGIANAMDPISWGDHFARESTEALKQGDAIINELEGK